LYIRSINSMTELIRSYLLQNKSISIPGLGTIYIERIPVQSDFVNRQLLAPSYHFRFDKYFDAPGKEFFTYMSSVKNIQDYEAIKMYNEWALNMRNTLGNDQPAVLEGIGSLKRDTSGEVIFNAEGPLKSFEITVPAERIIRTDSRHNMLVGDKEVTNVEMNDYLQEEVHKEKISWWVYAVIIAAFALVAIFFHFYNARNTTPFGNHQSIPVK
jgi:hypothetical protein